MSGSSWLMGFPLVSSGFQTEISNSSPGSCFFLSKKHMTPFCVLLKFELKYWAEDSDLPTNTYTGRLRGRVFTWTLNQSLWYLHYHTVLHLLPLRLFHFLVFDFLPISNFQLWRDHPSHHPHLLLAHHDLYCSIPEGASFHLFHVIRKNDRNHDLLLVQLVSYGLKS